MQTCAFELTCIYVQKDHITTCFYADTRASPETESGQTVARGRGHGRGRGRRGGSTVMQLTGIYSIT